MRKQTVVVYDDFDGTPDASTVYFSFKGVNYEVDLSAAHEAEFAEALRPWIEAGRRSIRTRARGLSTGQKGVSGEARKYLRSHGYDVPDRGRIPYALMEKFYEAFPEKRS